MPPPSARTSVQGLNEVRRDLRSFSKESGREFDRRARQMAGKVRDEARAHTPRLTGRAQKSIRVSSTYKGIAVRSSLPYFGQMEYGRQIWLNRGYPYPKPTVSGNGPRTGKSKLGSVVVDQFPAKPGKNGQPRVINRGRYLIKRRRMINAAADKFAPVLEREAERMIEDLKRRYHLN